VEPPKAPVAAVGVRLLVDARTTSGAVMVVVAPPHAVGSTAMMLKVKLPGGVAAVVATDNNVNWLVADDVADAGEKVAVAPDGNPVALNVTVQVPRAPVNDTFTELEALAPYWAVLPAAIGLGDWAPSSCRLLTRSTVVNAMSFCVVVVASNRVRTRA